MPPYDKTGFSPRGLMTPGRPEYSFGGFDDKQALGKFLITQVQITTNVATITGALVEGNSPAVGQILSIRGTQTDGGVFNVSNIAITAVNINALTGIGTISFALVSGNFGPAADSGAALIQVSETSDTLAAVPGKAFALQHFVGREGTGRVVTWSYRFTTPPTAVSINLEGAIDDIHDTYHVIDTGTNVNGETRAINVPSEYNFIRLNLTGIGTGGAGAIGKMVMY